MDRTPDRRRLAPGQRPTGLVPSTPLQGLRAGAPAACSAAELGLVAAHFLAPRTGLQRLATGQRGGRGAGRRQAGRFAFPRPPPLSLSSCPGSVRQRREQSVYQPLPLFEAHFRSTRELLPKKSNHSTFKKTKQTSQWRRVSTPESVLKPSLPVARWGAGTGSKPGGAAQRWVSRHPGRRPWAPGSPGRSDRKPSPPPGTASYLVTPRAQSFLICNH